MDAADQPTDPMIFRCNELFSPRFLALFSIVAKMADIAVTVENNEGHHPQIS
jgi:hypothetical protein